MTKIKYKIIISIILNIFISNFAFAEEVKNIREENKNTVSLGLGTIPLMHMPFIFGLEYARNISKNFSLGLGFKNSTFTINEISINSKYYLNFPNENSSFFIQANLGASNSSYGFGLKGATVSYQNTIFIFPMIGYESKINDSYSWNIGLNAGNRTLYRNNNYDKASNEINQKIENDILAMTNIYANLNYYF